MIAKILELSARTGKQLRVLRTVIMQGVAPGLGGEAGNLDQGCNVLSLGPAGVNMLVECFSFGRVDGNAFTARLPQGVKQRHKRAVRCRLVTGEGLVYDPSGR